MDDEYYTKQYRLVLPQDLLAKVKYYATLKGDTINTWIVGILQDYFQEMEGDDDDQ